MLQNDLCIYPWRGWKGVVMVRFRCGVHIVSHYYSVHVKREVVKVMLLSGHRVLIVLREKRENIPNRQREDGLNYVSSFSQSSCIFLSFRKEVYIQKRQKGSFPNNFVQFFVYFLLWYCCCLITNRSFRRLRGTYLLRIDERKVREGELLLTECLLMCWAHPLTPRVCRATLGVRCTASCLFGGMKRLRYVRVSVNPGFRRQ